jgi:hypothetical protein
MNTYAVEGETHGTYTSPYDQWSAIESIQRALQYVPPKMEVEFVCAMFEADQKALPELPCRKVTLTRSTKSEYEYLPDAKELPFIQDIIDVAVASQEGNQNNGDDFYVMLTNSDIGLTKYFYQHLLSRLEGHEEAITINRLSIPTTNFTKTVDPLHLLTQVDLRLVNGTDHPGHDCFVIHSSVLKRFRLGNMFAGYPPWGSALYHILMQTAQNFTTYESGVNGTFHLGKDTSKWLKQGRRSIDIPQEISSQENFIETCPVRLFGTHLYTLLNTINCGKWYGQNRAYKNRMVPNFVQPGYEEFYLKKKKKRK